MIAHRTSFFSYSRAWLRWWWCVEVRGRVVAEHESSHELCLSKCVVSGGALEATARVHAHGKARPADAAGTLSTQTTHDTQLI